MTGGSTLRSWLAVSAAAHVGAFALGYALTAQSEPAAASHGRIAIAFREPTPTVELERSTREPEWLPVPPPEPVLPEWPESPWAEADESPSLEAEPPLRPMPDGAARLASLHSPLRRLPQPVPACEPAREPAPELAPVLVPEPAAAEPGIPFRAAVPLHRPWPEYPRAALRRGDEGSVLLRIEVNADGHVHAAEVAESSGSELLDRAARAAVLTWRYRPARRDGAPSACSIVQRITFRLAAPRP